MKKFPFVIFFIMFFVLCSFSKLVAVQGYENCLLFFPFENGKQEGLHFVIKIFQKRDPEKSYPHRSKPIKGSNLNNGEWINSYLCYEWNAKNKPLELYAWGKIYGKAEDVPNRLKIFIGTETSELKFSVIKKSKFARLLCANVESGKKFFNNSAYKKWAGLNNKSLLPWKKLIKHFSRERRRLWGNQGRSLDLYGIFTGISAIRETLQTDTNLSDISSPGQRACHATLRVILGAVEMYNMDHSEGMKTLDLELLKKKHYLRGTVKCRGGGKYYLTEENGVETVRCSLHGDPENPTPDKAFEDKKEIKVTELEGPAAPSHPWETMIKDKKLKLSNVYNLIPFDSAFVHYPSYKAFRKSFDFFDDWASTLGTIAGNESSNFKLEKKIKDQLLLKTDLMTKLFADFAIKDIVFICEDPFLFEGSAFAVLLKINNELLLKEKLAMTAKQFQKDNSSISESNLTIEGKKVQVFSSPDFRFRSYRFSEKGFMFICNSPMLAKKLINTSSGKVDSVSKHLDLHYFYEHIEKNFNSPERVFAFLSDAFIRKVISPAYRVGIKRRLECVRNSLLQAHEVFLSNGKLNPAIKCPGGGTYKLVNGEISCSNHRSFGNLKPISESLPVALTSDEAEAYKRFVASYNRYFTQFFDPIGFTFTTETSFRGRLLIMPLVKNGAYAGLQNSLKKKAMKEGPVLKNCVMKLGVNLQSDVFSPSEQRSGWYGRKEFLNILSKGLTGAFWVHVADHSLLFQWDSNTLVSIIMDFAGGRGNFSLIAPTALSFFSPILFSAELTDEKYYHQIIEWLKMEISMKRIVSWWLSPELEFESLYENNMEIYVFSLNILAIKKTYYLTLKDGFIFVSSQKDLLFKLKESEKQAGESLKGNFNLVIYPQNMVKIKPSLAENRARSQRQVCLKNLRNLTFIRAFCEPEKTLKYYKLLFGAVPSCPVGGSYSFNKHPISCDIHGSIIDGDLLPNNEFLPGIKSISIESFVEPEGFQSEIRIHK
jgi:hypothetical protein